MTTLHPLERRRATAHRCPPLACNRRDPLYPDRRRQPTDHSVEAYCLAAQHLAAAGLGPAPLLPELRLMWQRGGAERRLAQAIVQRWEIAA